MWSQHSFQLVWSICSNFCTPKQTDDQVWSPFAVTYILLNVPPVSMLRYTYSQPHANPWGRFKWPYAITRLTAHFTCGLMSDLVICKFRKSIIIHDTECRYWDQVSLNNKPLINVCNTESWGKQSSTTIDAICSHDWLLQWFFAHLSALQVLAADIRANIRIDRKFQNTKAAAKLQDQIIIYHDYPPHPPPPGMIMPKGEIVLLFRQATYQ